MVQSNGTQYVPTVAKLRAMLKEPGKIVACPGIYDGYTARIALQEGVDCLYMVCLASRVFSGSPIGFRRSSRICTFELMLIEPADRRWHNHVPSRHGRHGRGNHERHA